MPNHGIALYQMVAQRIREDIQDNLLPPGALVPSEEELQRRFRTSRTTVRAAIETLVREGFVRKDHGRGTFVRGVQFERIMDRVSSFTYDVLARGLSPSSQILRLEETEASPSVRKRLQLGEKARVVCLDRLRFAGGEPICVVYTWIPAERVPGFVEKGIKTESLYDHLEWEYGIAPEAANEVVEAGLPTEQEASLLGIDPSLPVLTVKRLSLDASGAPIELVDGVFRSDRWRYRATLSRALRERKVSSQSLGSQFKEDSI